MATFVGPYIVPEIIAINFMIVTLPQSNYFKKQ